MNKIIVGLLLCLISLTTATAQEQRKSNRGSRMNDWSFIGSYISKDSVTRGPYTLLFINKDSAFNIHGESIKKKMIDAFFTVYPKQAARFNPNTSKKVTFIIDPNYKGVAAASGGIIRYSPLWMLKNPGDIDVVTHEVFHVVQSYAGGAGPSWLTEGITDYVRYKYGVDNAGAGWSLPELKPDHSYTNSYRITGRFLAWLENNVNQKVVEGLDAALRTQTYTPETWAALTGKSLDDLWLDYTKNPKL